MRNTYSGLKLRSRPLRLSVALCVGASCALSAHYANAACTSTADLLTVNCSGTLTTSITVYDPAAAFQPTAGGNGYTPANPAFPAATNPNNPGYNPKPPTATINFDATTNFSVTTNTTASLADRGMVAANFSNSENPAVNNVIVNNAGVLSLTTAQIAQSGGGRMDVLVGDSQVNTFTVNNSGTVSATQNFFSSFNRASLSVAASGSTATSTARYAGATLANVADFYSDDNTNEYVIVNAPGAKALASGNYATVVYGRADTTITNSGLIANVSWTGSDSIGAGHWAIATWAGADYATAANTNPDSTIVLLNSDGSVTVEDTSATTITNKSGGTIQGDILALDTTPLVYAANGGNPAAVSGSNAGPRDSNIQNHGLINGNIYLGSGTHVLDNAAGATLNGNINVDQRASQASYATPNVGSVAGTYLSLGGADFAGNACPAAGKNTTDPGCAGTHNVLASFFGGRSLTVTNEGTLAGNITINDQPGATNSVTLAGSGFTGAISALNGTGSNSLILNGASGSGLKQVQNFTDLNLTTSNVTITGGVTLEPDQNATQPQATIETTVFGAGGTKAAPTRNLGSIQGTLTLNGPTLITPTIAGIARNGDVYQLASTVTGAGVGSVTVTNASALVTASVGTSGGALVLTTQVADAATVPRVTQPGAAALNGLLAYGGSNTQVQALGGAVETLVSPTSVRAAAEQLRPEVNGATIQVPIDLTNALQSEADGRLDLLLVAPGASPRPDSGFWMNGLGAEARQQTVAGVGGFKADTGGLIAGYDRQPRDGLRLGALLGVASSKMEDTLLSGNRQSLQSVQGMVYGQMQLPLWFVDASVGAGSLNFDTQRTLSLPNYADSAAASYGGMVYSGQVQAGFPVATPVGTIAPLAVLSYVHVQQDAYQESSAGGAALSVGRQATNSVRPGIGVRANIPLTLLPSLGASLETRALYEHELGTTAQSISAAFADSSGSFTATGPAPSRETLDLGVTLRVELPRYGQMLAISYNGVIRNHYTDQIGMLRVRLDF